MQVYTRASKRDIDGRQLRLAKYFTTAELTLAVTARDWLVQEAGRASLQARCPHFRAAYATDRGCTIANGRKANVRCRSTVSAPVTLKTAEYLQAGDLQKDEYGYRIYQGKGGVYDCMYALYFIRITGTMGRAANSSTTAEYWPRIARRLPTFTTTGDERRPRTAHPCVDLKP